MYILTGEYHTTQKMQGDVVVFTLGAIIQKKIVRSEVEVEIFDGSSRLMYISPEQ